VPLEASISDFENTRKSFTGCRECDRVFTGVEAFDKHRVGEYGVNRSCATDLPAIGLCLDDGGRWKRKRSDGN
jgi:hypothetical protein